MLFRSDETLGWIGALRDRVIGRSPARSLREAIGEWQDGARKDGALTVTSDEDERILEKIPDEVDIVVAGHTHVRRSQTRKASPRRSHGQPWYFNSGTWIVRFEIEAQHFASDESFRPLWEVLQGKDNTPGKLLRDGNPLLKHGASAVRIVREGDRVRGELLEFPGDDAEPAVVPGSGCSFPTREDGGA